MQPLVIRKSPLLALQMLALGAVVGTAGVLAIVQGNRPVLGACILAVAAVATFQGVGILRDRAPWLQIDADGVHYREGSNTVLHTVPWTDIVDARAGFSGGRSTSVRLEVELPVSFTPRPSWWQRLLHKEPEPVSSREVEIDLWATGVSGVRVARAIVAYQAARERGTLKEPRYLGRIVRGDFA